MHMLQVRVRQSVTQYGMQVDELDTMLLEWKHVLKLIETRNKRAGHPLHSKSPKKFQQRITSLYCRSVSVKHPDLSKVLAIAFIAQAHVRQKLAAHKKCTKPKKLVVDCTLPTWQCISDDESSGDNTSDEMCEWESASSTSS